MAKEITRRLKPDVERELWARAAGRCQFSGCNRLLFQSPVTKEAVHIGQKAHIYSFSEQGPRGWGLLQDRRQDLNAVGNLLLVCHDCHVTIDHDKKGERYSAELLMRWKGEHERRIAIVTGIVPSKRSHVVLYGASIGEQTSRLRPEAAMDALFPTWYPAEERAVQLSMTWERKDDDPSFWGTEEANLVGLFARHVEPRLEAADPYHFSVFALAPMPLLVKFGSLWTDKVPVEVYQLHREPQTWRWLDGPDDFDFEINRPSITTDRPVLSIALSAHIARERVTAVLGDDVSIWELTISKPGNDFLRAREQLSKYRSALRQLMVEIGREHGKETPLHIFPAMPVACAVELGRARMPKADPKWIIYDHNDKHRQFVSAISVGGNRE